MDAASPPPAPPHRPLTRACSARRRAGQSRELRVVERTQKPDGSGDKFNRAYADGDAGRKPLLRINPAFVRCVA